MHLHPLPDDAFLVVREASGEIAGARWRIRILAASHLVEVTHAGGTMSELLACGGEVEGAAYSIPPTIPPRQTFQWTSDSAMYTFRLEAALALEEAELDAFELNGAIQLSAHYPAGPGQPQSITRVVVDVVPHQARLASLHWYQNEGIAVVTRSVLMWR